MKNEPLTDVERKPGRTKYTCGPVVYIEAEAGATLADHIHDEPEKLWIISGKGEFLVGDKTHKFEGPCILEVPGGIYHKFMPETDVNFIEQRSFEEKA